MALIILPPISPTSIYVINQSDVIELGRQKINQNFTNTLNYVDAKFSAVTYATVFSAVTATDGTFNNLLITGVTGTSGVFHGLLSGNTLFVNGTEIDPSSGITNQILLHNGTKFSPSNAFLIVSGSVVTLQNSYLPLSGGVMTGALTGQSIQTNRLVIDSAEIVTTGATSGNLLEYNGINFIPSNNLNVISGTVTSLQTTVNNLLPKFGSYMPLSGGNFIGPVALSAGTIFPVISAITLNLSQGNVLTVALSGIGTNFVLNFNSEVVGATYKVRFVQGNVARQINFTAGKFAFASGSAPSFTNANTQELLILDCFEPNRLIVRTHTTNIQNN